LRSFVLQLVEQPLGRLVDLHKPDPHSCVANAARLRFVSRPNDAPDTREDHLTPCELDLELEHRTQRERARGPDKDPAAVHFEGMSRDELVDRGILEDHLHENDFHVPIGILPHRLHLPICPPFVSWRGSHSSDPGDRTWIG
jgi:hypothetical protein